MGEKNKKNKRTIWAWLNLSARRLSCDTLHSLYICRLSLTCSFCEISTSHEECGLILTGLPSLLLEPISCRLVSSLSGVDCHCHCHSASPVANWLLCVPLSNSWLGFPCLLPVASRSRVQNPLSGFAPKKTKGSSAWRTTYIVSHREVSWRPKEMCYHWFQ